MGIINDKIKNNIFNVLAKLLLKLLEFIFASKLKIAKDNPEKTEIVNFSKSIL